MKLMDKPLAGLMVLDFSQFLSGPSASLRMADLGARVVKVEKPDGGDICRQLYISNLELDGESTLFHSINRNKESITIDLKNDSQRDWLHALIRKADILLQNFRPGVMEKLGLSYKEVATIHPGIVYGTISGYGSTGPWTNKPGQDLLVQSLSGLAWLTGEDSTIPVALGLSMVDMLVGANMLQGVMACLIRQGITGLGGHVEVSMIETALDMQCANLTLLLNRETEDHLVPVENRDHLSGIYRTADGYVAIAVYNPRELKPLRDFLDRHAITEEVNAEPSKSHSLAGMISADVIRSLEDLGVDCCKVLNWKELLSESGYHQLDMVQTVSRSNGTAMSTLRCPLRIDGHLFTSERGSPMIGEHTEQIRSEMDI